MNLWYKLLKYPSSFFLFISWFFAYICNLFNDLRKKGKDQLNNFLLNYNSVENFVFIVFLFFIFFNLIRHIVYCFDQRKDKKINARIFTKSWICLKSFSVGQISLYLILSLFFDLELPKDKVVETLTINKIKELKLFRIS